MEADILLLIGRILLGGYFSFMGLSHFAKRAQYKSIAEMRKVPNPNVATLITGLMLFVGGLSLLLGVAVAWGIIILVAFLLMSTLLIHSFWKDEGDLKQMQQMFFMRNLAFIGALLMLYALYSPDWQWALNIVW